MNVVCMFAFLINGFWTNVELPGKVIEDKGDYWLVEFEHTTDLVNSNKCLRSDYEQSN